MVQVQPPTPKPQEIVSFWGLPTDTNSNPWSMLLPNSNQPPQQAGGESESWKWWISSWQMLRYTPMTQGRPNSAAYLLPTNMGNIKWPFFCLVSWHGSKNYHIGNFQMRKQSNNLHQMSDSLVGYIAVFSSVGCFQRCFFFLLRHRLSPSGLCLGGTFACHVEDSRDLQVWCAFACRNLVLLQKAFPTNSLGSLKSVPWKNLSIWKEQGGRTMWNIGVKVKMWSSQNRSQNIVWNHTAINNPRLVSHLNNGGITSDLVDSLDQKGTMPGRHSAIPDPTTRAVGLRNMMVKFIVSSIKKHPI